MRSTRTRNQKVKIQLVTFSADTFRKDVTAADAEIAAYFEKHKEDYRIGERRKIKYLVVDVEQLRPQSVVTSREIERSYNSNIEMYTTPEQVRASHILLKTQGKDEAAVRKTAEKILAEAKAGADFAGLAKKYSEDERTAKQGGDLDYISRNSQVPEFEQAAFAMEPGAISDVVKTMYGFEIIKVADKKPATTRTLDEVRAQIREQLARDKAQKAADALATEVGQAIKAPADLDKVALARGWKVQESGFFTRDEPVMDLGGSAQLATQVFSMKEGDVSPAIQVSRGYAFVTVTGKQDPSLPKLEDVRDRVRDDTIKEKAKALALARATSIASSLKSGADFAAAAKKAGLEAKTSELVARGAALPDVGISAAVDKAAFSLTPGTVSDPIETTNGTAIIKVLQREDVTPGQVASGRDTTKQELLNERRGRFFSSYMVKAKQKMGIEINRQVLDQVVEASRPGRAGRSAREAHRHQGQGFSAAENPQRRGEDRDSPALAAAEQRREARALFRPAERVGQDFVETPARGIDHEFHALRGGDLRALLRERNGAIQAAKRVNQAALLGLRARSRRDLGRCGRWLQASAGARSPPSRRTDRRTPGAVPPASRARTACRGGPASSSRAFLPLLTASTFIAQLLVGAAGHDLAAVDPDRSRQGAGLRDDVGRGHRHVVAARGGQIGHRGDQRDARLLGRG